jgi:ribosomal protein S18 acetylase RimI-like enzyme
MNSRPQRRPELVEDAAFLFELYARSRQSELAAAGWNPAAWRDFLQVQFRCRESEYRAAFETAQFQIIQMDDLPVGRIVVHRAGQEIHIVDLALLPAYCGSGIGTTLISELQKEATSSSKRLRLEIVDGNPVVRFYQRLGFRSVGRLGAHEILEWSPQSVSGGFD